MRRLSAFASGQKAAPWPAPESLPVVFSTPSPPQGKSGPASSPTHTPRPRATNSMSSVAPATFGFDPAPAHGNAPSPPAVGRLTHQRSHDKVAFSIRQQGQLNDRKRGRSSGRLGLSTIIGLEGQMRPKPGELGPSLTEVGRTLANIGQESTDSGQLRPMFGPNRPTSGRSRPNVSDEKWPKLGRNRGHRMWPMLVNLRSKSGQNWPKSGELVRIDRSRRRISA